MSDSEEDYQSDSDSSTQSVPKINHKKKPPVKATEAKRDSDDDVSAVDTDDDEMSVNLDADSEGSDDELNENDMYNTSDLITKKAEEPLPFRFGGNSDDEDDENDEDELDDLEDDNYLQKLDESVREQTIRNHHPELMVNNYEEINALTVVTRVNGIIKDDLHKTLPILTKYERARILGERARQINEGAKPFIDVKDGIIDGFLIAEEELKKRVIPFIIRRPLSNGACEYWKLSDLEIL